MSNPRKPLPHEAAKPFDYAHPTCEEMCAAIGGRPWVIARRTPRIIERYGASVICVSPKGYAKAEARAIATRGWARPVEIALRDLVDLLERTYPDQPALSPESLCIQPAYVAALEVLARAREP